jgi:voltage-gated potassium channel
VIILFGIIGFMVIEKFSFLEAVYMTTIAVTTTGFSEVRPLSDVGRLFTTFLLILSWGAFALIIARITQYVISGEINRYFKTRRIMASIEKMNKHIIICGFGRNGQQAAHTLKIHSEPFVVIEINSEMLDKILIEHTDLLYVRGDGTEDDVLVRAGIHRAKALITTLPVDAENLFVVLSAKALNPKLQIISRASQTTTIDKLKKAGADSVIMPDRIGGAHMATLISKPDVVEFIDYLSGEEGESINMESVAYEQLPHEVKDSSLHNIMGWKKTGVNCIGIKTPDGKFVINPPDDILITPGMKVILLGTRQQIQKMKGNIG